jgi:hypothetical protein
MAFTPLVCPRTGRPIRVVSKRAAIALKLAAQRELLRDRQKTDVPDDISTPTRLGERMKTIKHRPAPYVVMEGQNFLPDRPRSPELRQPDFEGTRQAIAKRLERHDKAAPQRKRKLK